MFYQRRVRLTTALWLARDLIRAVIAIRPSVIYTLLVGATLASMTILAGTAYADVSCSPDSLNLGGSSWLNGDGVNVCSADEGSTNVCVAVSGAPADPTHGCTAGQVWSGTEWQCVEMVNRLYLTRGWTTATWDGNGGGSDGLIYNLPSNLTDQANGSISYVNVGDVITLNHTGDNVGHAAIINSIDSNGELHIINQNTANASDVYSTATLNSGTSLGAGNAAYTSSWSGYSVQAIVHHPASTETNYLITRSGSTLQGKAGIADSYTGLSTIASDEQAAGTRIAMKSTSGEIYAKDGLGSGWYDESGPVDQYAVSSDILLTRSGNTLKGKAGLTDGWSTLGTGTADMKVAENRIAVIDTSGNIWAKDTVSGGWNEEEIGAVSQYAVTPSYLLYRSGNTLYGKAGLTDTWSILSTSASDVQASGTLIAMKDTSGNIWAKATLTSSWYEVSSSVAQYAVSSNYLLIRIGNQVSGKAGLNDTDLTGSWTILYNPASDFKVGGTRIAVVDNSTGDIYAKDALGGDWYLESTPVGQYSVTSTLTGEP